MIASGNKTLSGIVEIFNCKYIINMHKVILMIIAGCLQAVFIYAQTGELDPSFGDNGHVITGFGNNFNRALSVAINNEGEIFAAGATQNLEGDDFAADFAIAKYNADGSLATDFGDNGLVITDINNQSSDVAMAVAIQDDGKIVVAGRSHAGTVYENYSFAIARYNPDGTLDPSFGVQGKVSYPYESYDDYSYEVSMALQPDGKIVVTGTCYQNIYDVFMTVRFTTAGQIDPTFGVNGKVITSLGEGFNGYPNAIAIQPDGKILVGGVVQGPISYPTGVDFALVRYEPNGNLDSSFGSNGIVITPVTEGAGYDWIDDLEVLSDGKIIAVGNSSELDEYQVALVKYKYDGTPDNAFGTSGIVLTDFGSIYPYATGVAVNNNNDILVCGNWMNLSGEYDFILAKFSAHGIPVQEFGENGMTISNINSLDGSIDVKIQSDGKIVAAGLTGNPTHHDFVALRYLDYIVPGNAEPEQECNAEIFPNPVEDILTVRFQDYHNTNFKLMDSRGRQMLSIPLITPDQKIELGYLSAGNYYMLLEKKNEVLIIRKMMKE
jgi:uncharacterized delta-60 repeat protein